MIVDTSAIVAVVFDEPAADACLNVMLGSPVVRFSAAGFLEASIVVDRLPDARYSVIFDDLLHDVGIGIEHVSVDQVHIAREAYQRFGRGSGHPARLNFGDCFAYALAKDFDESLLFIGNDFIHTDVRPALSRFP